MKTFLALIGSGVLLLAILGFFGIGNFVLMYSPNKITCVKDQVLQMKSKYIENWEYEYGGVQKRSIWSKTKLVIFLVLMALWFIPVLGCYILWDRFFGVEE